MITFKIVGTFEAENIDDAIEWLGKHFTQLAKEKTGAEVDFSADRPCHIDIQPT